MNIPVTALTIKGNHPFPRLNVLQCSIEVCHPNLPNGITINGIWDTGASNTVITKKVVDALGLKPIAPTQSHTAGGTIDTNSYVVDIVLPNKARMTFVSVTEVLALAGGCDALIGMDIITMGDFSITNHNGITCMSFRLPSCHEIDYVKMTNPGLQHQNNIGPGRPGSNFTPPKKKRKKH